MNFTENAQEAQKINVGGIIYARLMPEQLNKVSFLFETGDEATAKKMVNKLIANEAMFSLIKQFYTYRFVVKMSSVSIAELAEYLNIIPSYNILISE